MLLNRENPNVKSVIIIRNPMERTRSHHSFSYSTLLRNGLGDMNTVVDLCLSKGSRLAYLSDLVKKVIDEVKHGGFDNSPSLSFYVDLATAIWTKDIPGISYMNSSLQVTCGVITTSLYFHYIYHWDQIFGKENVLIIEGERLTFWRTAKKIAMKKATSATYRDPVLTYTASVMTKTQEEEIADIFR
jgi:hypothetical protein